MKSTETVISIADSLADYYLKFDSEINSLKSGEEFDFSFSPKFKHDEKLVVELDTIHERKAHIIIVSEDLEYFNHIHPDKEVNGEYSVKVNLPFGGRYYLFIEYKPNGSDKIIDHFILYAEGKEKSKAVFKSGKYSFDHQNLSVTLDQAEDILSGTEVRIPVAMVKEGREMNAADLDNYLGEKAHTVLIGISDLEFIHVHPMVRNKKLELHLNIPKQGFYRLWLQFQIDGKLYTTDFVIEVKPSNQLNEKSNHDHHKH